MSQMMVKLSLIFIVSLCSLSESKPALKKDQSTSYSYVSSQQPSEPGISHSQTSYQSSSSNVDNFNAGTFERVSIDKSGVIKRTFGKYEKTPSGDVIGSARTVKTLPDGTVIESKEVPLNAKSLPEGFKSQKINDFGSFAKLSKFDDSFREPIKFDDEFIEPMKFDYH